MFEQFPTHWFGAAGAMLTTICWLLYGISLNDLLIASNAISTVLTSVIIAMKLRHG